jgi:hypothetical protein
MGQNDRRPLRNTPVTARLSARHNDRLGAVYSALYGFWSARHAAVQAGGTQGNAVRRDAYSIILFDNEISTILQNDFQRTPDELLNALLAYESRGGTDYTLALNQARAMMERHWDPARYAPCSSPYAAAYEVPRSPVIVFLSDGECSVDDTVMQDLCRRSLSLGCVSAVHTTLTC